MELAGRTALVTGGGSGIGAGIALALAEAGSHVAICGRRNDVLSKVAARFAGQPPILAIAADVADRASVESLFKQLGQRMPRIDILVNCAGINIRHRTLAETEPDEWERLLAINATGAYLCSRAVLSGMRERRDGLIINISSVAGKRASRLGGIGYSASKFAMTAFGTCLAMEEGANGIRVSNIYPGEVETPILDSRPIPVSAEHRSRILQPEDIAAAVLMIARLPPRAHVAELVIKPTSQEYA